MDELFDGSLYWKEFASVTEAHVTVSETCDILQKRSTEHRVIEIWPLASATLALMVVAQPEIETKSATAVSHVAAFANWRVSRRARVLIDALYSLNSGSILPEEHLLAVDWTNSEALISAIDKSAEHGCRAVDVLLRRSGPSGGTLFLAGVREALQLLNDGFKLDRSCQSSGFIALEGDYRRYWTL